MDGLLNWLRVHKPAASYRTHLLVASALWSVVGTALLGVGIWWTRSAQFRFAGLLIVVAIVVGALKARYVLARTAKRITDRIVRRGDGHCIGGFLPWRFWGLVVLMAGGGRLLRTSGLPLWLVGTLYTAVGTALLLGSRSLWRTWYASGIGA